MSSYYIFDIVPTTGCNLRCKYCYEGEKTYVTNKMSSETISCLYDRIDELLDSDFIHNNFNGGLSLQLFGGEPTTTPEFVNEILNRYKNNDRVEFIIFTNGYNLTPIEETLNEIKDDKYRTRNKTPKCITQISFDGTAMQDINRLTIKNKPSSDKVTKNIDFVIENKIPFAIKSTVTEETFHLLPESYEEMKDIAKRSRRLKYSTYFPTLDYTIHERNLEKYKPIMKEALLKIAKQEIYHFNMYKGFFFKWFTNSKALCSAGYSMSVVDVDGRVYPCHGCLYGKNLDKHCITTVQNTTNFINIIEENSNKFFMHYKKQPEMCRNCEATFCTRCNATKFECSTKEGYFDKWIDHTCQPDLCEYYTLTSEVRRAIEPFLEK